MIKYLSASTIASATEVCSQEEDCSNTDAMF